ncbi:MAG: L,D-transpeptidase family protein [Gemmatimonadales bacterium]|nr:L,D-transpeptidase family protein [Gemmatimonadales bacterium]
MRKILFTVLLAAAAAGCHKFDSDKMEAALESAVNAPAGPRYAADRWSTMQAIYRDRNFEPIWLQREHPRATARGLVEALTRADDQGLRMRDYDLAGLRKSLENAYRKGGTTMQELADLDLRLTSLYLDYGKDLLTGRLDPAAVDTGWYIKSRRAAVDSTLRAAIRAPNFEHMVAPLLPKQPDYAALVKALEQYRAIASDGGWPDVPAGPPLAPGISSERVAALRVRLAATGDIAPSDTIPAGASASFDATVAAGVRRFQARHGLDTTGVVDRATLAALNVPVQTRIRQIELNLERLRWLPPDLGPRYVLVNIPDYRLHAYDGGRDVLTMRVVVGSEYGHATPVFADTLSEVVFRPTWNVPRDITNEEVIPMVRKDPDYLAQHHYELVRGNSAEPIDPRSIDWNDVDTNKLDFRVRQQPGDDNSLGRVKFLFPNQFDVYMHDTPARTLFGRNARALSHGCVRLEHPDRFAGYVLQGESAWTSERIQQAMTADSTRNVRVKRAVPVYIVYLTAFATDGVLQFRHDPYGTDGRAIGKIGNPAPDAALDSARVALQKFFKS